MISSLRRTALTLADLVFPPSCVACGQPGALFCDACAQAVAPIPQPCCPRCGQPQAGAALCASCVSRVDDPIAMARAVALFAEPLRPAIHALKYANQPQLAPLLGRYLVAALASPAWQNQIIDVVIPVPLHADRLASRGYNQSALLARHLCHALRLPLEPDWLVRHRDTRPQVGLTLEQRDVNVHDSFTAQLGVAGKRVLLIDDVYTTGATLRACAAAARDAGAAAIYGLTLARPLLQPHMHDPLTI
mgnify:CR=1 FL=1